MDKQKDTNTSLFLRKKEIHILCKAVLEALLKLLNNATIAVSEILMHKHKYILIL